MDDERTLPGDHDGLNEDDVEALLSSLGAGGDAPPSGDSEGAAAPADDRIIKQEDIDALLDRGLKSGKEALGASRELIAAPQGQVISTPRKDKKGGGANINLLVDVPLKVKIELGRNRMSLEDILRLKEGSIVELNKLAGDPLDVLVNDRLVAKGEVLVLNDNFCVRITEIVNPDERQKSR
ncbi:MAG: flagellar motor switch protein FliN [Planctomycetota bacterium]|jgi:flagellar motor switch protein FliN/FliY